MRQAGIVIVLAEDNHGFSEERGFKTGNAVYGGNRGCLLHDGSPKFERIQQDDVLEIGNLSKKIIRPSANSRKCLFHGEEHSRRQVALQFGNTRGLNFFWGRDLVRQSSVRDGEEKNKRLSAQRLKWVG